MELKISVVLCLIAGFATAKQSEFYMDIEEQGVEFQEHIVINEEENYERIEVPPHNEVAGTVYLHDFSLNLTLRVSAGQDTCFLTDLAESIDNGQARSPRQLQASMARAQRNDARANRVTVILNQWAMGDRVDDDVLRMLSEAMTRECPDKPIRWLYRLHDRARVRSSNSNGAQAQLNSLRPKRDTDTFIPSCQPQNMKFRCKREILMCDYIYYETCDAERWRRGRRKYAKCIDNNTLHIIDEVKCCRECCSVEEQADDFFQYCESFDDFDCSEL